MKKVLTFLAALLLMAGVLAQSPEKMTYQAVIRASDNELLKNRDIGMQISILQGSVDGVAVYREIHLPVTNANGLVSIEIGSGTILSGEMSMIDWSRGPYYVKTEIDPAGGTHYTITATSQMLSVPYALYAQTAQELRGGITETDPAFQAWDRSSGIFITESQIQDFGNYMESESDPVFSSSLSSTITAQDISGWNNKPDSFTESDPEFASSAAAGIKAEDITTWNNKLGSYTESDPEFTKWDKSTGILIKEEQIVNLGSYLRTESDPVFSSWDKDYGDLVNRPAKISDLILDADSQNITHLAHPVNPLDAVNKAYVNELLARIESLELYQLLTDGFTDPRDGNVYQAVKIGNQIWMAENLRYFPYSSSEGEGIAVGGEPDYYVYGYQGSDYSSVKQNPNYLTYGVLYTRTAAMNGSQSSQNNPSGVQGICPPGWHLPSLDEWDELRSFLGGLSVAGGKLKETGTAHWDSPNVGATDEAGFIALPGGVYKQGIGFYGLGQRGKWWTTDKPRSSGYYSIIIIINDGAELTLAPVQPVEAISVRCVQD